MGIENWSTTPGNNNSAPPDGAPEGMYPSAVNNVIRECMAAVRTWYESAQYADLGDTPTYVDADTFTVVGDLTSIYSAGRPIRCYGTTMGTLYGVVSSSSYSSPNTTVNVTLLSGSLTSNLSVVSIGICNVVPDHIHNAGPGKGGEGIYNMGLSGVYGLHIDLVVKTNSSDETNDVDIEADAVFVENSDGKIIKLTNVSETGIQIDTTGAGGRCSSDSLTDNDWYYIYVIYNSGTSTKAGYISKTAYTPTSMPTGYDFWGMVGAVYRNYSSQNEPFIQRGRIVSHRDPFQILTAGTSTSASNINIGSNYPECGPTALGISVFGYTHAVRTADSGPCVIGGWDGTYLVGDLQVAYLNSANDRQRCPHPSIPVRNGRVAYYVNTANLALDWYISGYIFDGAA